MDRNPAGRQYPTYLNPVFNRSFPDPFVLKYCGEYFAYCTGFADDGLAVGVARSSNLVDWAYIGGALKLLESAPPYYWAPEVIHSDGKFYMYYSCGNETLMEIRVAVSDKPDGGFVDAQVCLTKEEFAIDAHVFVDEDGERYMFYATDFLKHSHIGTGTVVDRMLNWFELEGNPRPVTRAAYDWQVYDPNRAEKGGVRWHTVEGPTVFKHKDKYIEMFSGGNWQNSSYGVAFASSNEILSSREWIQSIDGETLFPVLKTIPGKVVGPGHNSAVVGPNNRELYCVYHSWVGDERVMSIDRMGLIDSRLFVQGATHSPQPAPFPPSVTLNSDRVKLLGLSSREDSKVVLGHSAESGIAIEAESSDLLLDFNFRIVDWDSASSFSVSIESKEGSVNVNLTPGRVEIERNGDVIIGPTPDGSDPFAFRQLKLEISGNSGRILLDGQISGQWLDLIEPVRTLRIRATHCAAEIAALAVTYGFSEFFENTEQQAGLRGWETTEDSVITFADQKCRIEPRIAGSMATKGGPFEDFEFLANIRSEAGGSFGFALLDHKHEPRQNFSIERLDEIYSVVDNNSGTHLPLPGTYSPEEFRQFRIVKIGEDLIIESEDLLLGQTKTGIGAASIGILSKGGPIELEMVRWTEIGEY